MFRTATTAIRHFDRHLITIVKSKKNMSDNKPAEEETSELPESQPSGDVAEEAETSSESGEAAIGGEIADAPNPEPTDVDGASEDDESEHDEAVVDEPIRRSMNPTTPFDYPSVSPIFLAVLAAWFGYDGWFNPSTKSVMFNRIVFGFLLIGAIWTLRVDLKIMAIQRARKAEQESEPASDQESRDESE